MTPAAMLVWLLLGHEFLDTRELRYEPPDLAKRIASLRDAPPVSDSLLFTYQRNECSPRIVANRGYRDAVQRVAELYPGRDFTPLLDDLSWRYDVWDAYRDAVCEYYHRPVRREALAKLRRLVGRDAFYAGRLPSHVPEVYTR